MELRPHVAILTLIVVFCNTVIITLKYIDDDNYCEKWYTPTVVGIFIFAIIEIMHWIFWWGFGSF